MPTYLFVISLLNYLAIPKIIKCHIHDFFLTSNAPEEWSLVYSVVVLRSGVCCRHPRSEGALCAHDSSEEIMKIVGDISTNLFGTICADGRAWCCTSLFKNRKAILDAIFYFLYIIQ